MININVFIYTLVHLLMLNLIHSCFNSNTNTHKCRYNDIMIKQYNLGVWKCFTSDSGEKTYKQNKTIFF